MKNGVSSIWEGKIMPSILRGSKKHNEALLAKRRENEKSKIAMMLRTSNPAVVNQIIKNERTVITSTTRTRIAKKAIMAQVTDKKPEELFKKMEKVVAKLEPKSDENAALIAASALTTLTRSSLHCEETLDSLPSSPKKAQPILLSPFSQAKLKARQLGVGLNDECRGMYDHAELDSRIEKLAKLNAKIHSRR